MNNIKNILGPLGSIAAAVGVMSTVAGSAMYDVDGGQRAVLFQKFSFSGSSGVQQGVVGEGTHFLVPWFQQAIIYDIRSRPFMVESRTGTKDLQHVDLKLRVLFRPQEHQLPAIHVTYGPRFEQSILPSIVQETLKSVVARYNAEQLLTMREKVSEQIKDHLTAKAVEMYISIDDIAITHLAFDEEFTTAIERKQVAQQDVERVKFDVQKAEQEKLAAIIRSEGESEAAKILTSALTVGPALLELRRLEAAKEIATTLAKSPNVVFVPNHGNMILNVPKP